MKSIVSLRLFQFAMICFHVIATINCWASSAFEEEGKEIVIPKKKFPVIETLQETKNLKDVLLEISFLQEGCVNLEETSLEIVQKFPFITRNQRKYPSLNLANTYDNFDWPAYTQQLMLSYLGSYRCSLGDIILHLKDNQTQFKFSEIECLFALTFQEIISYNQLYSIKKRVSDFSKITDIQKAMCLHQVPAIVALSLSSDLKEKSCKILVLYDFNEKTQTFIAKDILQLSNSSIPIINISYMVIQLFALEVWVGYNSTLAPRSSEPLCIDPI